MAEIVAHKVDVIVTVSTPAAIAARKATATIPIVAGMMGDPVGAGLATSLAHPGGNLTGLSYGFSEQFAGKWLEILRECVPNLRAVAVLYNPQNSWAMQQRKDLEANIAHVALEAHLLEVTNLESLDKGMAQARRSAQAIVVVGDPLTYQLRGQIASLAMRHRLPMVAPMLEFVEAGGLMSYGVDNAAVLRRMAEYVDRVLRGVKPSELPIEQPTQLLFAVNLRTADLLGLTIPAAIHERADRVIR
jgi:putative ABC transport system substrate-binding protein